MKWIHFNLSMEDATQGSIPVVLGRVASIVKEKIVKEMTSNRGVPCHVFILFFYSNSIVITTAM